MSKETLSRAMSYLDDDIVAEAHSDTKHVHTGAKTAKTLRVLRRVGLVAACLCFAVLASFPSYTSFVNANRSVGDSEHSGDVNAQYSISIYNVDPESQRLCIAGEGNPAVTWTRENAYCVVAELTVNDAQAEQLTFFMSGKTATGLNVILMEKSVHVTTVDEEGNTSEGLPVKAGTYRLMFDYSEAVAEGFLPDGVIELLPFGMYMLPADVE